MKHKNQAFTLVELIVVIVILSILATIAFLSFSSQSSSARDSIRLADMSNISKGLSVFQITAGNLPMPDSPMTISSSGFLVSYQGYAGSKVLNIIKMSSNSGKDPSDQVYYTYSTNSTKSTYEILGFLENQSSTALNYYPFELGFINADPTDYSKRYISTKGTNIGILLSNGTLVPAQANTGATSMDLKNINQTNVDYVAYLDSKTTYVGTGTYMGGLLGIANSNIANSIYPGCDTPDIKVGNQVWATCNVGATQAWNSQIAITQCMTDPNDCNSSIRYTLGSYFQWGRNINITSSATGAGPVDISHINDNIFFANSNDWLNIETNNLWGGSGTTFTGGTYLSQGNPAAMQGPCSAGYHVPTYFEWYTAVNSVNPLIVTNSGIFQNDTSLVWVLKLPYAGYRTQAGTYTNQLNGHYYCASPDIVNGFGYVSYVTIRNGTIKMPNLAGRSQGLSVRCLKN